MKKVMGIILIVGLAGLLGWQIYQRVLAAKAANLGGGLPGQGRGGSVAVAVEIAEVKQQTIQDIGQFTGSLSPKSQFMVAPKVAGQLVQLLVNIGDPVKQNQLIAKLDDDVARQNVAKAQADLDMAKASLMQSQSALETAKRELDRAQTLFQKDIQSQSALDTAKAKYDAAIAQAKVAQATVANRQSSLETTRSQLAYTEIRATWENGNETRVVGERFVDAGAILQANAPIVSILDVATIVCVIQVIERDYFRIKQGQTATIDTDALPGKTFTGQIVRIAPLLAENSRQARVEIEIPNPENLLKPGMFVRVQLAFDKIDNATVVPAAALVKRNEQPGVFLADLNAMKARFVPVKVGVSNNMQVQIIEPQLSGSVVTIGQYLLEDGTAILLPQKQAAPTSGEHPQRKKE
jgi:RND family efflux transporter MFP subunit